MALARLFYTKIINGEDKEDEAPFVAPKSRGGGGLVLPCCIEASFKDLVGDHTAWDKP